MNEQISTLSEAVDVGPPPTFTGDGRGMKSILDQAQTNLTDVKESLLTNCDRAARAIRVHFEAQVKKPTRIICHQEHSQIIIIITVLQRMVWQIFGKAFSA